MERIPLAKTQSKNNMMTNKAALQTYEMEDFLNSFVPEEEYISHEEYWRTREPLPEETIRVPEEISVKLEPSEYAKDGEITRMLRDLPGILPPAMDFPKSYVQPKPLKQPDIILNDRIPIMLSEKYFKFDADPVGETTDVSNCTDGDDEKNGNNSSGYNGRNAKVASAGKTDYKRQFWTVFGDSDFDEIPVKEMQRCTIAEGEQAPVTKKPTQRYYTPYEIYMKKRGNKKH